MADIYNDEIGVEWVNISNTVTFQDDTDYFIQNQGNSLLQAYTGETTPDVNTKLGVKIPPMMQGHYKVSDGELYLKGVQGPCRVNISEAATGA